MREKDLQDLVEKLISVGQLVDRIVGWKEVEAVALDRRQGTEKHLLLDDIVLHRAAGSALMVRDRLGDLTPVTNDAKSISLDRSQRLFADLLHRIRCEARSASRVLPGTTTILACSR